MELVCHQAFQKLAEFTLSRLTHCKTRHAYKAEVAQKFNCQFKQGVTIHFIVILVK